MDYTLLRKYGRNFKLWSRIRIEHWRTYFFTLFFALQLGIEISFPVVTINICVSWLPILINQWMHTSVVHIGYEEPSNTRNKYVSRWYFFCNVRYFLSYQYEPLKSILLFIFRNYLLLVFEKKCHWMNELNTAKWSSKTQFSSFSNTYKLFETSEMVSVVW